MRVGLHVNGTAPWQLSTNVYNVKYSRLACCFLDVSCQFFSVLSISATQAILFASLSNTMAVQLLTQAEGYGIIIGLSVLFCLIIVAAVQIQKRYLSEDSDESEMFMVANRSVGTGLTASAVFSSWFVNRSYEWSIHL